MKRKRASGEGTVFRRKNGVWVAATPRPLRKTFTSRKSQADAMARRDEWLAKHDGVQNVKAQKTLRAYLLTWLHSVKPNVRASTWNGYSAIVETHILPLIGQVQLGLVQPQHIQQVLNAAQHRSAATRTQIRRLLWRALEVARKWDVIWKNPVDAIDVPKRARSRVTPLPTGEMAALLRQIADDRHEALWLLYIATGMRRGEALAIDGRNGLRFEWRKVGRRKVEVAIVTVRGSLQRVNGELRILPPKSDAGARTIELAEFMTEPLRRHLAQQEEERTAAGKFWQESGLLFTANLGTPLEPRNISRRWHALLATAKLERHRLHDVRHTAISILLQAGVDIKTVQQIAGHSRASITLDTYSHLLPGTSGVGAKAMNTAIKKLRGPTS